MIFLYDLFFIAFAILYFPYMLIKGKMHRGLWTRFGAIPRAVITAVTGKKVIWVHAVSVGEVLASVGVIEWLQKEYPHHHIVVSTVTKTGNDLAYHKFSDAVSIIYAPFDLSIIVRRYIRLLQPVAYIVIETEIWPNVYTALAAARVPIVLINGRISDAGFVGYRKMRFITRKVLPMVSACCMQSQRDAERIIALGAVFERVQVVGNVKFDAGIPVSTVTTRAIGIPDGGKIFLAGSTHPGEEGIMLAAYRVLREEFPDLHLIIAPRHVERANEVADIVRRQGCVPVFLSAVGTTVVNRDTVVVVDTIGMLAGLYQLATVVFVGKSLTSGGGQNMIEPASWGKATIVGPLVSNFRDVVALFVQQKALLQVRDADDLLAQVRILLADSALRERIGRAARAVVAASRGATERTCAVIRQYIP